MNLYLFLYIDGIILYTFPCDLSLSLKIMFSDPSILDGDGVYCLGFD